MAACMYACTYVHVCICNASWYVCTHACMHACMYVCMYVQITISTFGPNIPIRTDSLSEVQKVGPKDVAHTVRANACAMPPDVYGYLPQGPYLLARHFDKRAGMPRSKRS